MGAAQVAQLSDQEPVGRATTVDQPLSAAANRSPKRARAAAAGGGGGGGFQPNIQAAAAADVGHEEAAGRLAELASYCTGARGGFAAAKLAQLNVLLVRAQPKRGSEGGGERGSRISFSFILSDHSVCLLVRAQQRVRSLPFAAFPQCNRASFLPFADEAVATAGRCDGGQRRG